MFLCTASPVAASEMVAEAWQAWDRSVQLLTNSALAERLAARDGDLAHQPPEASQDSTKPLEGLRKMGRMQAAKRSHAFPTSLFPPLLAFARSKGAEKQ